MAINCNALFSELERRGIVDEDFARTLQAMEITPQQIQADFDGFILEMKTFAVERSKLARAQYLSNSKAGAMYDKGVSYLKSKGENVSQPTTNIWSRDQYNLMNKATNEQKSIIFGDNMFGKSWVDPNGKTQIFASLIEENNLHNDVLRTLTNVETPSGLDANLAEALDGFRRHIDAEAGNLVGTKALNTANMIKSELAFDIMDQIMRKFNDENGGSHLKKSFLKMFRGEAPTRIKPSQRQEFLEFARKELADIIDPSKNSEEAIINFLDNQFFKGSNAGIADNNLNMNVFNSLDKTSLFESYFTDDFMADPVSFGSRYNINSVDILENFTKKWSRRYGVYDQLGARPFETLDILLKRAEGSLDKVTYQNLKSNIDGNFKGGLVADLKIGDIVERNVFVDTINSVANLVLAPRLLSFAIVNLDDLSMRAVMSSAVTGDSAIARNFLDNARVLANTITDFITAGGSLDKKLANQIGQKHEGNVRQVLMGIETDGIPRSTNKFMQGVNQIKDAYNTGGITRAGVATTGSNALTFGNQSLEKSMLFVSGDVSDEVMGMIKRGDFNPNKAFLTQDAIKRHGITEEMLAAYRKTDKISNFANDLSDADVLRTMKLTKDNMRTTYLDGAVQAGTHVELQRRGLLPEAGRLDANQIEKIKNQVMKFYSEVKGADSIPEDVLVLLNDTQRFEFLSNGGEVTVRIKEGQKISNFDTVREKRLERDFNAAYKDLIQNESSQIRRQLQKQITDDLVSGRQNPFVDNFNKKIDSWIERMTENEDYINSGIFSADSRELFNMPINDLLIKQRNYLDTSFENLRYQIFQDHFGLNSTSYDTGNTMNELMAINPTLAVYHRINTFYKATLGRSNLRMQKLLNAKLGDGTSLSASAVLNNPRAIMNAQVLDMMIAATVGTQIVNALKSDLSGKESFEETMTDPRKWLNSLYSAPYVSTPIGMSYTSSLGQGIESLNGSINSLARGDMEYAQKNMDKFRTTVFGGTGYNIFDNWILSNAYERIRPDAQLGDPLTEIFAYTSRTYRKESGYTKLASKEKQKRKKENKK